MSDDDDALTDYDLDAWDVPAPADDLADGVIARLGGTEVGAAVPVEPLSPRRSALRIGGVAAAVIAASLGTYALIGSSRHAAPTSGAMVADRAQALSIEGVKADLDPGADVRWTRDGKRVHVEQREGTAAWRVDGNTMLVIDAGATVASVEATGSASLRVEVQMNSMDTKIIGASALTAAAVAMVTVVVYEGHVKVSRADHQTVIVEPGSTWQSAPPEPVVAGTPAEDKTPHDPPQPAGGSAAEVTVSCDEASCVLDNYAGACCQKFRAGSQGKTLDRVAITDGIEKVKARVLACGDKFPGKGVLKIAVWVRPEGTVERVEVKQAPTPALGNCVAEVMRSAQFAESDHGGSFTYPFVFDRSTTKTATQTADCDADAVKEQGMEYVTVGQHAAALAKFEQALRCKSSDELVQLAFMSACNSLDSAKAKVYYQKLPARNRERMSIMCIRNKVEFEDAPRTCDASALKDEGMEYVNKGVNTLALTKFEASLGCKNDAYVLQLAFMASCNSKNSAKAKKYYALLSPAQQKQNAIICERNKVEFLPSSSCSADDAKERAMDLVNQGQHAAALAMFEESLRCAPDAYVTQLAFMAACNSLNSAKAKVYYKRLTPAQQSKLSIMCKRNKVDYEDGSPAK